MESILDFDSKDRIEIRYNSEWLKGLNLNSIIELMGSATAVSYTHLRAHET